MLFHLVADSWCYKGDLSMPLREADQTGMEGQQRRMLLTHRSNADSKSLLFLYGEASTQIVIFHLEIIGSMSESVNKISLILNTVGKVRIFLIKYYYYFLRFTYLLCTENSACM